MNEAFNIRIFFQNGKIPFQKISLTLERMCQLILDPFSMTKTVFYMQLMQ